MWHDDCRKYLHLFVSVESSASFDYTTVREWPKQIPLISHPEAAGIRDVIFCRIIKEKWVCNRHCSHSRSRHTTLQFAGMDNGDSFALLVVFVLVFNRNPHFSVSILNTFSTTVKLYHEITIPKLVSYSGDTFSQMMISNIFSIFTILLSFHKCLL